MAARADQRATVQPATAQSATDQSATVQEISPPPFSGHPSADQPHAVEQVGDGLDARLAQRFGELSPTEQRVAQFFADNREEVGFVSAVEIAQQLGTSDATVVRTAQRLGYAGLPELKRELLGALRTRGTVAVRLGRRLEQLGDEPATLLDQVLSWHIQLIEQARRTLRPEAFARAVDILQTADRVVSFGVGPSATLAEYMTIKLARFGQQSRSITATGMGLADQLLTLRAGDALLVMSYGRLFPEVEVTLDRARAVGAPVILLTDRNALDLAGRFDVALQSPRGLAGALGSVVNTMVVLDALLLGFANRNRATALEGLNSLNDLRAKIVGYRIDIDPTPYEEDAP